MTLQSMLEKIEFSNRMVTALLILLCLLAGTDLVRQYLVKSDEYHFYLYSMAVKSTENTWRLGYRIEALDERIAFQQQYLKSVQRLSSSFTSPLRGETNHIVARRQSYHELQRLVGNESNVVQMRCSNSNLLRVGSSDFNTDPRESCAVFATAVDTSMAPNTMFEIIDFHDGSFGLKSLANGYFVSMLPPTGDSYEPYRMGVGGIVPGPNERFRLAEGGIIYSGIAEGFLSCSGGRVTANQFSEFTSFTVERIPQEYVQKARELVDISKQIQSIQRKYLADHIASQPLPVAAKSTTPIKICIGIPLTSKGTVMYEITESPLWSNMFDSFMNSIDWKANKYVFGIYLGFDKADPIYDTGDAWSDMRREFKRRATDSLKTQMLSQSEIDTILSQYLKLKLNHFAHLEGAPTQVVSQLMLQGYADGYDYFYQINDDTRIMTNNWPSQLITALASNPIVPNLGVTGPLDLNNDKIFTHSFVHRTHIDIFGYYFPPSFKNWWSDDWITHVYGDKHIFRLPDVQIKHNVEAQKESGYTRYTVDQSAQFRLEEELLDGYIQIDTWLKKHALPRLTLPVICDYIPLMKHLAPKLAVGFSSKQEKEVIAYAAKLGGKFFSDLLPAVTHLIVCKAGTRKHEMAISRRIHCVTYNWIVESAAAGAFLTSSSSYAVPPFLGLVISITGVEANRQEIISMIETNGGTYSPELKQGYCTHLIATSPRGVKYEHAKQWKSVKVASPEWIQACAEKQAWLTERNYPVLESAIETAILPARSVPKIAPSAALKHVLSEAPVLPEALVRLRELSDEDIKGIPDSDVFQHDVYYFSGFNEEDAYKLVQLLAIGGGVRHHMLSERVTRVVLGPDATSVIRESTVSHPAGARIVKLDYFLKQLGLF